MDRRAELLRFIDRDQVGIEIGPWHTPLAPKRDGYQSISIDVFDVDTLRRRAVEDPNIDEAGVARIEDVDLIGPAQEIAEPAAARFGPGFTCDYVLASHDLEHIPDPIRFLQGCERILRRNGVVSLAIPDHRCCFDHFRTPSATADWLSAYFEKRTASYAGAVVSSERHPVYVRSKEAASDMSLGIRQLAGFQHLAEFCPAGFYS
jgi:SAM-dependent methyltransferase